MSGQIGNGVVENRNHFWAEQIDLAGLGRFLRCLFPDKTAERVAAQTGLPVATIRKWLSEEASPNCRACFALILTFGPEVIHATVKTAPGWLSAVVREEQMRALNSEIDDRRARLAALRP